MSTANLEHDLRVALAERADDVPEDAVRRITATSFPVRGRRSLRPAGVASVAIAGAAAAVMVVGHLTSPAPPSASHQQARVTPLAYVGRFPRLAVTYLPGGFKVGPLIPLPAPPHGDPPITDQLPLRTFTVDGNCGEPAPCILLGEGHRGVVAKVDRFAVAHPAVVRRIDVRGVTVTIVDLTAAHAGDGLLAYWPVSRSSWAVLSGTGSGLAAGADASAGRYPSRRLDATPGFRGRSGAGRAPRPAPPRRRRARGRPRAASGRMPPRP